MSKSICRIRFYSYYNQMNQIPILKLVIEIYL